MYTYDVYVVEYESGRLDVLDNFLKVFESYQYRVYNSCSDQLPGDIITNSVISTVRKSRSLFVLFDKSFFKNRTAMFEVEEGKQIKHGNQNFKLIVVELTPIPSEYLSYFELFSRITIQNNYEDRAYQHISRIITETDLTEEEIQVENCRLKNLNEQIVETTSEEVYYIRVVVLGQEGVGKTTLVRRLLKENISQVESTNGIEINVDKCGISLHNGKWEFKKDYVQYWTNTVHCYGDVSRNEDNLLNPPIIPVATHIDSIQHSKAEDYIDEYQEALLKSLGSDRRKDHFSNFFAISNTQSSEAEIEKLRQYIFAIAKQQEHWGVKVPVKWIPFWNKIEDLRLEGKTVVTVNDLWGINKSLPSPLSTKKELVSFLVLHHDIGNIIFLKILVKV
ncbi:unnamed protein product [Mytilus edulis]|uniref:TIR domain-containing protein n=1 Tax=Mytilus edulis TaxID=6550 RepID=A0A8S3RVT8_MYTED|nr:unnamed protein product [Mytilus edulis]